MFEFLEKEEKDIRDLLKQVVSLHFNPLNAATDSKTLETRVQNWVEEKAQKISKERISDAN